jgi:hypothetical protein
VTLRELLEAAGAHLDPIERLANHDEIAWRRAGRLFAIVSGDRAEFRLPSVIGRAALATPDTRPSDRGPEWIALAPSELDRMTGDRAGAWFESAWRHAAD